MEHYIVRIYRRDRSDLLQIVGLVEDVSAGKVRRFRDLPGFLRILALAPRIAARSVKNPE